MDVETELQALLVVSVVSVAAPFVSAFLARLLVPQVVVLIAGGVLIGPQVGGLAKPESVELVANVGLGFLFLLAGYELELGLFRRRPGRLATSAWLVTVAAALVVTGVLEAIGFVEAFVPIAIGLTTTALGTLLPILRDNDMLGGRFGFHILAAGAVGEFMPIVAITIFFGASGSFVGLLSLLAMGALAGLFTIVPRLVHHRRLTRILAEGEHATSQTTLRWTVFLLFALLVVAEDFGLDVVLGAFLAGVVLRRWAPLDVHALEAKLDAVGYGLFIPVFFVSSGMTLDLNAIAEAPERLLVFFLLLVVVRGLPALALYRQDLPLVQRLQMTLLTATALPLLVALSQIGLSTGHMLPENAAALVGAGVLFVMVYPGVALATNRRVARVGTGDPDSRAQRQAADDHPEPGP